MDVLGRIMDKYLELDGISMSIENILGSFMNALTTNPILGLLVVVVVIVVGLYALNKANIWSGNFTNVGILILFFFILLLVVYSLDVNFDLRHSFSNWLEISLDNFLGNGTTTKGNLFPPSSEDRVDNTIDAPNGSVSQLEMAVETNRSVV